MMSDYIFAHLCCSVLILLLLHSSCLAESVDSEPSEAENLEDLLKIAEAIVDHSDTIPTAFNCGSLNPDIVKEIKRYKDYVDLIIKYVTEDVQKGRTYSSLRNFTDFFGPRIAGGDALEKAIDDIVADARFNELEVHTEDVQVPHWVRNSESLTMLEPRVQKLNMLGLGTSVSTPPEGITGKVIVVSNFDELKAHEDIAGNIILYNHEYESYSESVQYRVHGAAKAAKLGAVAVLCRSVASFSIGSPHTGVQLYEQNVTKIPAASITVEDAKLMGRLYNQGVVIKVNLSMGADNLNFTTSRNVIIDYNGEKEPENFIVLAGHIDSWDVGQGVMDDAGGCFISYNAVTVLKELGLRPRRTVRNIWYTGEEFGIYGGKEYFKQHKDERKNYQLFLESDLGTFQPKGIGFKGSSMATCVMKEILKLTAAINTTTVVLSDDGPDINMWSSVGVPIGSLLNENSKYFWFHHSAGDSIDVEDSDTLDLITALWASVAYVTADMSVNLAEL